MRCGKPTEWICLNTQVSAWNLAFISFLLQTEVFSITSKFYILPLLPKIEVATSFSAVFESSRRSWDGRKRKWLQALLLLKGLAWIECNQSRLAFTDYPKNKPWHCRLSCCVFFFYTFHSWLPLARAKFNTGSHGGRPWGADTQWRLALAPITSLELQRADGRKSPQPAQMG